MNVSHLIRRRDKDDSSDEECESLTAGDYPVRSVHVNPAKSAKSTPNLLHSGSGKPSNNPFSSTSILPQPIICGSNDPVTRILPESSNSISSVANVPHTHFVPHLLPSGNLGTSCVSLQPNTSTSEAAPVRSISFGSAIPEAAPPESPLPRPRSGSWSGVNESDDELDQLQESPALESLEDYSRYGAMGNIRARPTLSRVQYLEARELHAQKMRRQLKFFFMNPVEKWYARHRFPWKLLLQVFKIIVVTIQLYLFAAQRHLHVAYLWDTRVSFSHMFLLGWDSTREVNVYPPSDGPLAVYTRQQFYDYLDYGIIAYTNLSDISIGSYDYHMLNTTTVMPSHICCEHYTDNFSNLLSGVCPCPALRCVSLSCSQVRVPVLLSGACPCPALRCVSLSCSQVRVPVLLSECVDVPFEAVNTSSSWSTRDFLASQNFTVAFDMLLSCQYFFKVKAVKLRSPPSELTPDCYNLTATVLFDNYDRDGQMLVGLNIEATVLSCDTDHDEQDQRPAVTTINILTMVMCCVSLLMCCRSLYRAQLLRYKSVHFFRTHYNKILSKWDELEFCNLWYVLICVNDILIMTGTILKLGLESRVLRLNKTEFIKATKANHEGYMDTWNICSLFLGVGNLLVWFGCLRYLGFFETYNVLILTLKKCLPNVLRYSICITMVFAGYCLCGWLVLSPYHIKFGSLSTTMECLYSLINGDDMFATFSSTSAKDPVIWWFSRLYLYSFISLFVYVILSLFLALIMDAYDTIKKYYSEGFPKSPLQKFIEECEEDATSHVFREEGDRTIHDFVNSVCCCCCLSESLRRIIFGNNAPSIHPPTRGVRVAAAAEAESNWHLWLLEQGQSHILFGVVLCRTDGACQVDKEEIPKVASALEQADSDVAIPLVPNVCSSSAAFPSESDNGLSFKIQAKLEETWFVDGITDKETDYLTSNVQIFTDRTSNNGSPSSYCAVKNIRGESSHSTDSAPVLSPIPEQLAIISSEEVAPALSPAPLSSSQPDLDKQCNGTKIFTQDKEVSEKILQSGVELSTSSNYETETNSDSSSLSSLSSPLQIIPVLHSQGESPPNDIKEQLDEFNLVPSFTAASVLALPSSPDLVNSSAVDVLNSLEDSEAYDDLSNINLSACPLSTIDEEDVQNEVSSLSTSACISFSAVSSTLSRIPVKDSGTLIDVMPRFDVNHSHDNSTFLCMSDALKERFSSSPVKVSASSSSIEPPNTNSSPSSSSGVSPGPQPETQLVHSVCINNIQKNTSFATHPPTLIAHATTIPQPLLTNIATSTQSSAFLNSGINPCVIAPILSPTVKTSIISPSAIQSIIGSNPICNISASIVQTPLSISPVIQTSVIPNAILQQPASQLLPKSGSAEHVLVQKAMPPSVAKSLANHALNSSIVSSTNSLLKSNILLEHTISTSDSSRIIVGNCNPNLIHQAFHPALSHQKFTSTINQNFVPYSVPSTAPASLPVSYTIAASTHSNPSIAYTVASTSAASSSVSSNFLNILPAGTIFSTNVNDRKPNGETPTKNTPALNNGASLYSVMFSEGDSTKITIKRTPPENTFVTNPTLGTLSKIPQIRPDVTNLNLHANQFNANLLKKPMKPKAKPKPKPKRKGCRCGNATPSPGKLTCCGQRCPCYVEAKACIECRCKGCRNPHRPGGKKVRPVIPHQANIRIHQIKPVPIKPAMNNCHSNAVTPVIGIPISMSSQFSQQSSVQNSSGLQSNFVASSVSSSSQTIRTLQAIHAVKAVQGIGSVQSMVSEGQIFNIKDSIVENSLGVDSCQNSIEPVSSVVSVKPMKFQFDTACNPLLNLDQFSHSIETENSDVEIDS
ncbi:E3 ubiquitin-protein ligase Msl2 CXC domain [Trinorchestia longiramus]|nr:E3 ubiquitin-protein ligase Msl2 CXC domain [Trinorchestia longiramus]